MSTHFPLTEPNTLTYIGHATVLLRLNGTTLLTDPHYGGRVGFYRRHVQPGISIDELPRLDAILVSHGHWDHLHKRTLERLNKGVVVVVPNGLQQAIGGLGFRDVRGLKPWDTTRVRGAEITAVPARHWGNACRYLVSNGKTVYFAGDTGLFDGMRTIGHKQTIDLALLPIGAYAPHLGFVPVLSRKMRQVHMAPDDIPNAAEMLDAHVIVPIHWGTFRLTGEPLDEPRRRLEQVVSKRGLGGKVRVVVHGETIAF